MSCCIGIGIAEPVDPCNPTQWRAMQALERASMSHWLPTRIRQLEEERIELLRKISGLPLHDPMPLPDHQGYHSLPNDGGDNGDELISLIEVQFQFDPELGAIALVPAIIPGKTGSYAFPKRFKIEVLDRGAEWVKGIRKMVIPPPPYEWTEVVNWMDEDFPDPGTYPVFFDIEGVERIYQLRMTMLPQGAGASFYALGELYLFRDPNDSGRLGDNMMAWDTVSLSASNSLSKPPLWSPTYLNDGVSGLGMPLSEEIFDVEDMMISWDEGDGGTRSVKIVLDLGRIRTVGRVQLWPAEAPHGMALPQFGFPGGVSVELSTQADFSDAQYYEANNIRERLYNDNLLNIITGSKKIRYIRLTLGDLARYKGKTILGLGEIRVSEYDEVFSLNCSVSASGIPPEDMDQLPRLVDGFSRKHRILREVDWIQGLALRRPLDARLSIVEKELVLAKGDLNAFKWRATLWGGGLVCFGLLGAMLLQRRQRRKVLSRLKLRITRDLHDEVGSNLGSISLVAERLEEDIQDPAIKEDLLDLSLLAREASASLKDVVWVIDQSSIRLPDLIAQLMERAQRVLYGMELSVEIQPDVPDMVVPLTAKRHLVMFFKEAVHNCARHSGATKMQILVAGGDGQLVIELIDNGCGFDTAVKRRGWGLDSMKKRAEELGGTVELTSQPGEGTTVVLRVLLSALLVKTDHHYKTSN